MTRLFLYSFLSVIFLKVGDLAGDSIAEFKEQFGARFPKGGLEVHLELKLSFAGGGAANLVGEEGVIEGGGIGVSSLNEAIVLISNENGDLVRIGEDLSSLTRDSSIDFPIVGRMQGVISNCLWNLQGSPLKQGNYDLVFRPYEDDNPSQKEITTHFMVNSYKGYLSTLGLPIQEGSVVWRENSFVAAPSLEVGLTQHEETVKLNGELKYDQERKTYSLNLDAGDGTYRVSWDEDVQFNEIVHVPSVYTLKVAQGSEENVLRETMVRIVKVIEVSQSTLLVDPMASLEAISNNLTVVAMQTVTNGVVLFDKGEHKAVDPTLNPFASSKRGTVYLFYTIIGATVLLYLVLFVRKQGEG